jgi:hypothetical protein
MAPFSTTFIETVHHNSIAKPGDVELAHARVFSGPSFEATPFGSTAITAVASFHVKGPKIWAVTPFTGILRAEFSQMHKMTDRLL